jgi:hypothetical protein
MSIIPSIQNVQFVSPQPVTFSSSLPSSVEVTNFPATQPVSGTVNVGNFPSSQVVSGSVSVSNLPSTQPVSGTISLTSGNVVNVGNLPSTQPISGTVALTSGNSVAVNNLPSVQPISGSVSLTVGNAVDIGNFLTSVNVGNFPSSQNVVMNPTPYPSNNRWITCTMITSASTPTTGGITNYYALTDLSGLVSASTTYWINVDAVYEAVAEAGTLYIDKVCVWFQQSLTAPSINTFTGSTLFNMSVTGALLANASCFADNHLGAVDTVIPFKLSQTGLRSVLSGASTTRFVLFAGFSIENVAGTPSSQSQTVRATIMLQF